MDIKKVIIPVAGWGTRSLPASKNIPKEMLPIYTKPIIQYVVEEAVNAGISDVVFITSREKRTIEDHFDYTPLLEMTLERAGKHKLLDRVREVAELVNIISVRQKRQLGLGHAIQCAKPIVNKEPFAIMLGDDMMVGQDCGISQLVAAAKQYNLPCIGVVPVPDDKISRYGIIGGEEIESGIIKINKMAEKPQRDKAPSNYAIVGRYVLTPDIFTYLERVEPGHGGEIQLTDALKALAAEKGMLAVILKGQRFDAGDWAEYLAANIYFSLKDDLLRDDLLEKLIPLLEQYKK